MKVTPRQWLWVGLGFMILFSLMWSSVIAGVPSGRLKSTPQQGLGFSSRDLPLNPTESQVYRQAEVLKRLYQIHGQRFILTAVDGARDRHAIHDPLYCFSGDGWQVIRRQTLVVPRGHANLLTLARSGRQTEVVFWFTDSRERYASAWRAWWVSLCRRLTFGQAGHEPALILLQPANDEAPIWSNVFAQCPFLFEI